MSISSPNWTKEEIHDYILIWCLNADFVKHEDELDLITSKIDPISYKKLNNEFKNDNDYQSIEKIKAALNSFNYTSEEFDQLKADVMEVFMADGKFDAIEQNLNRELKRILN